MSWFENMFSEFMNPQLAKERIEREKAQEREEIKKKLELLRAKLLVAEKTLKRKQKEYLVQMAKAKLKKDVRNLRKYTMMYKQCDGKMDTLAKIMVGVDGQILNVTTGDSLLDAAGVIDNSDAYFANLFSNITPESVEDKILNIGDKEVLSSEMETIMSNPHSNVTLSAHEEDEDLFAFADTILGFDAPPSNSGDHDPAETISMKDQFPSVPSSSYSEPYMSMSLKSKQKNKKSKKKLADMNIF